MKTILQNEDMKSLISIDDCLEEIMNQIQNGQSFGNDYSWHTARVALMSTRILIDKLYNSSNTSEKVE